jgi:hypothetical protein
VRALLLALLGLGLTACPRTPDGDGCLSCHVGIEPIHDPRDIPAGTCVACHGGDPEARDKEGAHVPVPGDWAAIRGPNAVPAPPGFIKDFTPDQLDAIDPGYLRFINPSDIRVNEETCGRCHPVQVETQRNSVMTTNSGHYMPTRFLAGLQDRTAIYGSHPAYDPDYDGSDPGSVPELQTLVPPADAGTAETLESNAYDHYLAKSCNHCHAASYGKNDSRGLYRSSGCAACHVPYGPDGVYEGGDEATPKGVPVHAREHRITSAIPVEQCGSCHFQGGRIGLLYRGIREGGFGPLPPNAEPWSEAVYGHVAGYYVLDEDTTNDVDETPPDVHYDKGLVCVDCHVGTDVHGDGRIYSTSKQQVDIACEDCHGTVREPARPVRDGEFRTRGRNRELEQLRFEGGQVLLRGRMDGKDHVVPQPAELLAEGGGATSAMHTAMGTDDAGWSHTDDVACASCHSGWQQFCIGCHVTVDYRLSQRDWQTGTVTPGLVRGSRDDFVLDRLLLSTGTDGRAWPTNPSQQVQMTVIGADGTKLLDRKFRDSPHSNANLGFSPFFQHTTTSRPRSCQTCHRTADTPDEWARVRGVYGYGTGEFLIEAADGSQIDALQFLAPDHSPLTTWVHEGTGPLTKERVDRALAVEVPR